MLILGVLLFLNALLKTDKLAGITAGTSGEVLRKFGGVKLRSRREAAGLC